MTKKTIKIIVALAVLAVLVLIGRFGFTVVKIEDAEKKAQGETFDPVAYVDSIWTSKLLPAFNDAVDASAILSEIQPDSDGVVSKESLGAVTKKYGLITNGEAHVYMVKGTGKVVNVEAGTSKENIIEVALDGYSGPIKVLIYVGTNATSGDKTAVRDAVGITLNDGFKSQREFGQAASEITKRALSEVVGGLETTNLMGKTISFKGAFSIPTFNRITIVVKEIRIVPIEIKVAE